MNGKAQDTFSKVSVIIPVAAQENAHESLLQDLASCPQLEIWIVTPEAAGRENRAVQLNVGARRTKREWLWFLHADTRLSSETLLGLREKLSTLTPALYYFDMEFYGGPKKMRLNAWGVWARSRCLGLPFGDQGFLVPRQIFERLQGYPEVAIGEDLLFVRRAKQNRIAVRPLGERLLTSARKYEISGWAKTTLKNLRWTLKLLREEI